LIAEITTSDTQSSQQGFDPELLSKDEKVCIAVELYAMQWSLRAIGRYLGITHRTAKKWIDNEHTQRSEHRGIDKEAHLAVYDAIQKSAWEAFKGTSKASMNRSQYLNTIKAAEDSKMKITGAEAPKKFQDVTEDTFEIVFDDNEPIPTEE